jgi:hypothetical protein
MTGRSGTVTFFGVAAPTSPAAIIAGIVIEREVEVVNHRDRA